MTSTNLSTAVLTVIAPYTGVGGNISIFACALGPSPNDLFCYDNASPANFMSFNTTTGVRTDIGTGAVPVGESMSGMAYDRTNGIMYASSSDCGINSTLHTVNLGTGALTAVGSMLAGATCNIALGYHDPTDMLYGHDIVGDNIVSVNKTTGASAVVGPTGFDANFAQGMECDRTDGTCYLFALNNTTVLGEVRTINLATGNTSLVGTIDDGALCGFVCEVTSADIDVNPLPVELTRFEGFVHEGEVLLRWETATEENNAGFEVQHQVGNTFEVLDYVSGFGTTLEAQHYSYEVNGLQPGQHVFRLKQIDYDGAFEYSPEVEVSVGVPNAYVLNPVYPNPFNPSASFTFAVAAEQSVQIALYNVYGQQVKLLFEGQVPADELQTVHIKGYDLPSGTYVVQLKGRSFQADQTVTLLK